MPVERADAQQIEAVSNLIEAWGRSQLDESSAVTAVDRDPEQRRWYVRMAGEEKSVTTIWLTVRELTLQFESYFMPAPEENVEACFEYLLRLNHRLFGMRFSIGAENAVFLVGQLPLGAVDVDELDRIVGSAYAYSEQYFRPAMRIGYASQFKG